jgi:hypothetical protein
MLLMLNMVALLAMCGLLLEFLLVLYQALSLMEDPTH